MTWIYRYKVVKLSNHPMHGKDIVLRTHSNLPDAIEQAKKMLKEHGDLCVVEFRYASEKNLAMNIEFDSHIRWASWLND